MPLTGAAISGWLRKADIQAEAVVVFVHGILSNGIRCWTSSGGAYWPALLEAETALKDVDVFVFSYKTSAFSKTYSLGDIVDSLKEEMRSRNVQAYRRVIFICHSMGGIVVRRYLVTQAVDLIERKMQIGLFLVASPSLGSAQANLLFPLIGLLQHSQAKVLRFHEQNTWLNDLDKDFINLLHSGKLSIQGKELVEDVPIEIVRCRLFGLTLSKVTVPPYSAARYFGDSIKIPDSSHVTICCPSDATTLQHRLLVRFVSELTAPPIAPVTFGVPAGWTFLAVAMELVNLDKQGAVLKYDGLTEHERNAMIAPKRIVASSIVDALVTLRLFATPAIREYRVEHIDREYRLILN
jgi:predicted alpha/beta hydrolase family esterase